MLSGSSIEDVRLGDGLGVETQGGRRHGARGDGQGPQRLARQGFVAPYQRRPAVLVEDGHFAVFPYRPALRDQDLWRTFDEDTEFAGLVEIDMNGHVALALRRERNLRNAGKARELVRRYAELACRNDQGALGRIALHRPDALALGERRIVGERGGTEGSRHGIAFGRRFGKRHTFGGEVALRDVAAAADLDQRAGREDRAYRHLVAGQRTGLVGADNRRGTQRLDGRQLAHDGIGGRHASHADAQPHGDDRRQRLGDGRDRQRHGEQEEAEDDVEGEGGRTEQPGGEHDGADAEHDDAEALAGAVEFLLQRRRLDLGGFKQAGDAADLGRHAGADDNRAAAAIGGDGAGEQHVAAITEADVGVDGLRLLGHRRAFAGQRSFVRPQVGAFDDARIGRDLVAGLDHHDVAGNDVVGRDPPSFAVANHGRFGSGKGHQRPHRLLGPRFLDVAQQGVEHDDRQNDDGFVGQGRLARLLQQPFGHRYGDGDQQDDHQEALELLEQPPPPGRFRGALQPVGPMEVQAPLDLGLAEAARAVGSQRLDHGFGGFAVWRPPRVGRSRGRVGPRTIASVATVRGGEGVQHHCLWHGDLRPRNNTS